MPALILAALILPAVLIWLAAEMADATARWEADRETEFDAAVNDALYVASPVPDTVPTEWEQQS